MAACSAQSGRESVALKVLLVGNYEADSQESMQRFANLIADGLKRNGHNVKIIRPLPILARGRTRGFWKWLGYLDKYLVFPFHLNKQLKAVDVVHILDHSNALYVHQLINVPHVITCHDLIAVRAGLGEQTYTPLTPMGRMLQRWILSGLAHARLIACDSKATREDAQRLIAGGNRTDSLRVIPLALNYPYRILSREEVYERLMSIEGLDGRQPFVLHVGSSLMRKNRDGVLRIFSSIKQCFPGQLVFAGSPLTLELRELAIDLQVHDRVIEVIKPDGKTLEALYNCAFSLLYPSRAEGFGWPLIEAQACGCPVVASNCGSCPEVAGRGALLNDLEDEAGFANSLLLLLDDSERQKYVELGFENMRRFKNEDMLEAYINAYRDAIAGGGSELISQSQPGGKNT